MPFFEMIDSRTVLAEDGPDVDVLEAIESLPWVHQLCPLMPHDYAVFFRSPEASWRAVEAMVRWSPASYRAYFRGYQSANRYWEAPDGLRYWRTGMMLNRCNPDSVEPLRRVDTGAKPIKDWDGPRWAPNGAGFYLQTSNGKWWPSPRFFADGYLPCKACLTPPPEVADRA